MNKKEDKFKIITDDEDIDLYDNPINDIEIVDTPTEVGIGEIDYEEKISSFIDEDVDSDDEVEETESEDNEEVVEDTNVEEDNNSYDKLENTNNYIENDISDKCHIGFGTRIFIMFVLVFATFAGACFLIIKTIDYSESEKVTYDESAKVNYKVCLNGENDVCLDENKTYKSSDIKNINATFYYSIKK